MSSDPVFIGPQDYVGAVHVYQCTACGGWLRDEYNQVCAICHGGGWLAVPLDVWRHVPSHAQFVCYDETRKIYQYASIQSGLVDMKLGRK